MKNYIDEQQLSLFMKSLPGIRGKIGTKDVSSMGPDYGVDGTTLRAYRGYVNSPSAVFRVWAKKRTDIFLKCAPTIEITTSRGFCTWHLRQVKSLNDYWKREQGVGLSFAHSHKLIDLYIKWLSQFKFPDAAFSHKLNESAFCALDKHTLKKINLCYCNCMPYKEPRMGDIYNKFTYEFCQKIIREFCNLAKATSLEFDFWAWPQVKLK